MLTLLAIALPTPTFAASPKSRVIAGQQLQAAEQAREAQLEHERQAAVALAKARAEAGRLAAARVKAASDLRQIEGRVLAASADLQAARDRSAEAEIVLHKREADFSAMLPIMVRLQQFPADTVFAVPEPPGQAVEGLLITRGLATQIEREAAALQAQRAHAEQLKTEVAARAATLADRRAQQMADASALDRQIVGTQAQMDAAGVAVRSAEEQAAASAAQADTLRGAIAAMDAARARAVAQAAAEARRAERQHQMPAAEAALARKTALIRPAGPIGKGAMRPPVAGPILRAWGSATEDGPATGVTFGTAPGAFVSSPCAGRVAFAAPFRSYGKLIIIECGGGLDVVLAGLDRLATPIGHRVSAGEPVGRMADDTTAQPSQEAGSRAGLYVEVRRAGRALDPAPFLNARS